MSLLYSSHLPVDVPSIMSGTNHNMNHIVKRIETRVLAPPGGFSSISFGSAPPSGDIYKGHDFNPKNNNKTSRSSKESMLSHSNRAVGRVDGVSKHQISRGKIVHHANVNDRKSGKYYDPKEKENIIHKHTNRASRDSLDELISNPSSSSRSGRGCGEIPGLEGHYRRATGSSSDRAVSPIDTSFYGRVNKQQSIGKENYAEMLRQQIATKKALKTASENSHRSSDLRRDGNMHRAYPQEKNNQQAASYDQQLCNRRTRYGCGGGQSSLSLSWE